MGNGKDSIRLNLGCGLMARPGWINVDGSWNARLAKHAAMRRALSWLGVLPADKAAIPWSSAILIHDIRKPLPFGDGTAHAIYASHVLEHLYREEGQRLIAESYRVLQGGGTLRVVVPDLRSIVEEYLGSGAGNGQETDGNSLRPADRFNQRLLMRWPAPTSSNLFLKIYNAWQDFHTHKWMYDGDSLAALFKRTGFVGVERKECHDSRIEGIGEVEDQSRIVGGEGVCIEGVKPEC